MQRIAKYLPDDVRTLPQAMPVRRGRRILRVAAAFASCALLASGLPAQVRSPDRKYLPQGVLQYGQLQEREAVQDFGALHPLMRRFAPPASEFVFDAGAGGVFIAARGTRLDIGPDAFVRSDGQPVKGQVVVRVREVIDAFDFATAGAGLVYDRNGTRQYFQSGGMFHVSAEKSGDPIQLAANQTILVQVPAAQSGDFGVYSLDAGGRWIPRGSGGESPPVSVLPAASGQAGGAPGNANPENSTPVESEAGEIIEGAWQIGARIVAIDGMTWWNFDQPYPHVACVKGRVVGPQGAPAGHYQIFSIGVNYRGAFNRWSSGVEFKINVHKDRLAKVLIVDQAGNVGVSATIRTPARNGFDKDPEGPANFCQDIGAIALRKLDDDLLKDRDSFMAFLGLPASQYSVNYAGSSSSK